MKITIDNSIKSLYPSIQLGCILFSTSVEETNSKLWEKVDNEICPNLIKVMEGINVTEIENIAFSRKAYKAFGKDPGRYRVSSEALYRRIKQGKGLYKINTVVDTNNLISLETGFSVGSYDLDNINGDIILRVGAKGESYKGIGKEDINIENLPVLCDENGPFGSPTSDSTQAMITLSSKRIITIIYNFSPNANLEYILKTAEEYIKKYTQAHGITSRII